MSAPPQAASTWYQRPLLRAIPAHATRGSIIPALVVPAVAAIMTGRNPEHGRRLARGPMRSRPYDRIRRWQRGASRSGLYQPGARS